MTAREQAMERLRAAIEGLAAEDIDELIAQARADARRAARAALAEALTEEMLHQAEARLRPADSERHGGRRATSLRPANQSEASAPVDGELLCYVYGVIASSSAPPLERLAAVDAEHPVGVVIEGALAAVVSEVAAADFSEQQLRAHLEDLEWVETMARRHEDVLDELSRLTTTIPMRMCTVYRAEDGVREMLRREAEPLEQALQHLAEKAEWGVKVFFDRRHAQAAQEAVSPAQATGAEYMQRKRRARDLEHDVDRVCTQVHEDLSSLSSESALNAPHRRDPRVDGGEMIMNGVYLVEDDREEEFHQRVRSLASSLTELGVELVETGPWPPYNFLPAQTGATW